MRNQETIVKQDDPMIDPLYRSFGLDLIRALAVCLVLTAHFAKILEPFGFWGVELFFALSGYLIGHILWRNFNQPTAWNFTKISNFWSRRWWRTLPNYYLFFIVSLFFHHYITGGLPSISKLVDFLWFGQNLTSRYGDFYGVSWSLCIEEWLYLTFPLVLLLFSKLRLSKKYSFVCTLISFYLGSIIIRGLLLKGGQGDFLRGITLARLDSIAYGIGMAYISSTIKLNLLKKQLFFLIGMILLFLPLVALWFFKVPYQAVKQNSVFLLIVPIGASLIMPLVGMMKPFTGGFSLISLVIEKLSLWTYSIYLSHIPVLITTYYVLADIRDTFLGNVFTKVAGLTLTIVISALTFKYFESPLTKKRPKEIKI